MSKTNNTIKLNGKHYDAVTGKPVHATHKQATHHAAAHAPQHAKTLMRHSVKRPAAHHKQAFRVQTQVEPEQAPSFVEPALNRFDSGRLEPSHKVPKSKLISRFGAPVHSSQASVAAAQLATVATNSAAADDTQQLFRRAIEQATSHEQPAPKVKRQSSRRRRAATITAGALASVALIGLFASQNIANVRLQVASAKAGFSAALPSYHPSGFHLGKLSYGSGTVAMNYVSNSDAYRQYSLVEKPSTWDSQALLDNFIKPGGSAYQVEQQAGQTYYLYGGQNITWVSAGVWYQVQSQAALGNQQLLQLAESL